MGQLFGAPTFVNKVGDGKAFTSSCQSGGFINSRNAEFPRALLDPGQSKQAWIMTLTCLQAVSLQVSQSLSAAL